MPWRGRGRWGMASLLAIWIPIVIIYRLAKNGVSGEVRISKLLGWGWGHGEGLLGWGWAVGIGWGMASLSAIWIPMVIIYRLAKNGVSGEVCISKLLGWALGIRWGSWGGDGPWGLVGAWPPSRQYGSPSLSSTDWQRMEWAERYVSVNSMPWRGRGRWGMASLLAIWIPIVIIYRLAKNGVSGEICISKLEGHGEGRRDYHLQPCKERELQESLFKN